MIKMTFDEFEKMEEKMSKLENLVELNCDISEEQLELILSDKLKMTGKNGIAIKGIEFLVYLLAKYEEMLPEFPEYKENINTINKVLNKTIELD